MTEKGKNIDWIEWNRRAPFRGPFYQWAAYATTYDNFCDETIDEYRQKLFFGTLEELQYTSKVLHKQADARTPTGADIHHADVAFRGLAYLFDLVISCRT